MLYNLKKGPKNVAFPLFCVFLHRFVISVRMRMRTELLN